MGTDAHWNAAETRLTSYTKLFSRLYTAQLSHTILTIPRARARACVCVCVCVCVCMWQSVRVQLVVQVLGYLGLQCLSSQSTNKTTNF